MMTSASTGSEYYRLPKLQRVRKILPQIIPILVLSIILPTSDIGRYLVMVTNLYKTETKRNVAGEAECENVELEIFLICYRY